MNSHYKYITTNFEEATVALAKVNPSIVVIGQFATGVHVDTALVAAESIVKKVYSTLSLFDSIHVGGRIVLPEPDDYWQQTNAVILAFSHTGKSGSLSVEMEHLIANSVKTTSHDESIREQVDDSTWHCCSGPQLMTWCEKNARLDKKGSLQDLRTFEVPLQWIHFGSSGIDVGGLGSISNFLGLRPLPWGPVRDGVESPGQKVLRELIG